MKSMTKRENLSARGGSNEHGVTGSFAVTAGEKCKVIGWQDGSFQDFGHHLRDEMGGIWVHPIKVADGFWLSVNGAYPLSDEYETLPYGTIFRSHLKEGVSLERFQFSPDSHKGAVIRYRFFNESDSKKELALHFAIRFDVLPVWFSAESGIEDFPDEAFADRESRYILAKDEGHDWYGLAGWDFKESGVTLSKERLGPCETVGQGVWASVDSRVCLAPGETVCQHYYFTGSWESREDAVSELDALRENREVLLQQKAERSRLLRSRSSLHTDDPDFDQAFLWVKHNTDWLVEDCGSYGRGLAAGLPEYPWWFGCDNAYSVQGLLAMGDFETARDTLLLLERYSREHNGNGRIVHEITTNGQVANPGNSQETGHYITAVYHYWRWTGDLATVKTVIESCEKGINWLLSEMDPDGDLLPSGYGIIEIKGLNVELIDTAVYTCQALYRMAELSEALGAPKPFYRETAERLKTIINTRLWNEEEKLYVDAVGTPAQILERIDILLSESEKKHPLSSDYLAYLDRMRVQLSTLPRDEEFPFLINKNWVISTPMETELADRDKAEAALLSMRSPEFVGDYGIYLAGFMHQGTMTISTGVQAVAEGRYGHANESLALLRRMFTAFGKTLPGSINEMLPDYGCFTQAWTCYAVLVPVVECFAGFTPQMQENKLCLSPCIPADWNEMSLSGVRVGNGFVDFFYRKTAEGRTYEVTSTGDFLTVFTPQPEAGETVFVNGQQAEGEIRLHRGSVLVECKKVN